MNKIFAVMVVLLFFSLFGCIGQTDPVTVSKLDNLKAKYGMEASFVPNAQVMSSYNNELALLKAKTGSRLVEAEFLSAQAFYYMMQAAEEFSNVDFVNDSCKVTNLIKAYNYSALGSEAAAQAKAVIETLSENEKKELRQNQLDMVNAYNKTTKEMYDGIKAKCTSYV
jgi:hypothetical protein